MWQHGREQLLGSIHNVDEHAVYAEIGEIESLLRLGGEVFEIRRNLMDEALGYRAVRATLFFCTMHTSETSSHRIDVNSIIPVSADEAISLRGAKGVHYGDPKLSARSQGFPRL